MCTQLMQVSSKPEGTGFPGVGIEGEVSCLMLGRAQDVRKSNSILTHGASLPLCANSLLMGMCKYH